MKIQEFRTMISENTASRSQINMISQHKNFLKTKAEYFGQAPVTEYFYTISLFYKAEIIS